MKASELIKLLEAFIKIDGDLNIGYYDGEFGCFDSASVQTTFVRERHKIGIPFNYADDDEELGDKFIGIQ